ncbi:MAG: hypothetical protein LBE17_10260, partial [Treponema sp.]|nr:hypothetical protein [Treponema sp.]
LEVPDLGLEVPDLGLEVPDLGLEVPDLGLEVPDLGLEVPDLGPELPDPGLRTARAPPNPTAIPAVFRIQNQVSPVFPAFNPQKSGKNAKFFPCFSRRLDCFCLKPVN